MSWWQRLVAWWESTAPDSHSDEGTDDEADTNAEDDAIPEEVPLEITEELDLHGFHPAETRATTDAYLAEAQARGFREVRIVHGRGKGVQRASIQKLLDTHPLVASWRDAPSTRGGWGATLVVLREAPRDG